MSWGVCGRSRVPNKNLNDCQLAQMTHPNANIILKTLRLQRSKLIKSKFIFLFKEMMKSLQDSISEMPEKMRGINKNYFYFCSYSI